MASWEDITAAITTSLSGDKESGLAQLNDCWALTEAEDYAQRCVIAHYLADLQADLTDELRWDERALIEHARVQDADLLPIGIESARSLSPSLHLNLGDAYRRQGRTSEARMQVVLAESDLDTLADDGYGQLIRGGIERLKQRLDESPATA